MWLYYFAILLVVFSNTFYHICQKSTPSGMHPVLSLMVTYLTAAAFCLLLLPFFPLKDGIASSLKKMNWASIALGVSIVGLEMGFLLAYRSGSNISSTQFVTTILVALFLVPIGVLFYHEKLSLINIAGILMCIGGFLLMNKK